MAEAQTKPLVPPFVKEKRAGRDIADEAFEAAIRDPDDVSKEPSGQARSAPVGVASDAAAPPVQEAASRVEQVPVPATAPEGAKVAPAAASAGSDTAGQAAARAQLPEPPPSPYGIPKKISKTIRISPAHNLALAEMAAALKLSDNKLMAVLMAEVTELAWDKFRQGGRHELFDYVSGLRDAEE